MIALTLLSNELYFSDENVAEIVFRRPWKPLYWYQIDKRDQ